MLLSEDELISRVESPLNLLNRLHSTMNRHSPHAIIPALPPKAEDIIPDIESKISNGAIKGKALGLITQAMDELKHRIPEVSKPRELAAIAAEMTRVITAVEPREELRPEGAKIVIYAPQIMSEDTFNIVELGEV